MNFFKTGMFLKTNPSIPHAMVTLCANFGPDIIPGGNESFDAPLTRAPTHLVRHSLAYWYTR